ncbi:MAG: M48 family metallopeptidase [Dehalococcoidia bacterium]
MTTHNEIRSPAERPQGEERARAYERGSLWLRLFNVALVAVALLAFLLSGASVGLRDWTRDVTGNVWLQVALYTVVIVTVWSVVTLPLDYLTDFRREHRYGLSTQRLGGWLLDQAKGFLLSLVLVVLVLEGAYWLLRETGGWWWLWAAAGMVALSIIVTSLGPVLFIPIFYKLQRIDDAELTRRLTEVAEREGARVIGVYRMNMSAKTRKANAMVAGLGRTQRIILGDTLLEGFTPEEIEVVVAHEVAHYRHRDLWKGIGVSAALNLVGLFIASRVLDALADRGSLEGPADIAALPVLLLSLGVYGLIVLPLGNAYSRRRESLADRAALQATGLAGPFISAMRRLASLNLANPAPHPLVEAVFYSHPSISRRIAMAERMK